MKHSEYIDLLVTKVIEWTEENTAGLVVDREGIKNLVIFFEQKVHSGEDVNKDMIDNMMVKFESSSGYLLKASDILAVILLVKS